MWPTRASKGCWPESKGPGLMKFSFRKPRKRAAVLLAVPAIVAAGALALPAGAASAATNSCYSYKVGGVSFSVCIAHVSGNTVKATVDGISGTYISGKLGIYFDGSRKATGCSGKFQPGNVCSFNYTGSSGVYHSGWLPAGGGEYDSPPINA